MKNTLLFSPAFQTRDGREIAGRSKFDKQVALPKKLVIGTDYAIQPSGDFLKAVKLDAPPKKTALGGFHVGLDGLINEHSIWDPEFRPACPDPRGMVYVPKVGWVDIYLTNTDPGRYGTSASGQRIADGVDRPLLSTGDRADNFNWWTSTILLAEHGKMPLSRAEFALAMEGVEEGKNAGTDPATTCHIPGLKSRYGIEQATGCMWTWSRDLQPNKWVFVLGGDWDSGSSGPRHSYDFNPDFEWSLVGARGRCDHLMPERSKAKA